MSINEQHHQLTKVLPPIISSEYTSSYLNSITWQEWNNIMAKELNKAGFRHNKWNSLKGCYEMEEFVASADNPQSFILGEVSKFEEVEYLKSRKLMNNGRCPKCGNPIIGNPCLYTYGKDDRINYHICLSCAKSHGTVEINPKEQIKTKSPNIINNPLSNYDSNNTNKNNIPTTLAISKTKGIKKWVLWFVLLCFITVIICIIASNITINSNLDDNKPTAHFYEVNNAFNIRLPNNWDFDQLSCPYEEVNIDNNDTIKINAQFDKGQLIFVPKGDNITDSLSAAIYVEYRKVDTKLIDLAHHNQKHQSAKQLMKYVEKSLKDYAESTGIIKDDVKYNYVNLSENKGFAYSCDLIDYNNMQTFKYSNYTFWNYDELITITVIYDNIDSEKWEKECSSIVNFFKWVNPK